MCGIAGWVGGPPVEDGDRVAAAMAAALTHRGPNGQGRMALPGATGGWMSHSRLRILDLSDAAHQPMAGRGGGVVLVFNGEVYNFRELRRELQRRGHAFTSSGDTEVVLRAYEQWGPSCVERFEGMFALAVWDARRGELLLARDRTGKKPLFVTTDADGRTSFASEIKALARAPWVRLSCDTSRLPSFLTFGYVPHPATLYEGIDQVAPATVVVVDAATGRRRSQRYWSPRPTRRIAPGGSLREEIRRRLQEATQRRLIADVPLGAFLSGGIDSSVVVALMSRAGAAPVRTFAAGLVDEASFDERAGAREVAQALRTDHTEFAVRADATALLDRLVWLHDGPFADSSAVPTFLVAEAARSAVTVVLTGDGGDEVFAGYQRFAAAALSRLVRPEVAALARPLLRRLPAGGGYHDPRTRLERFLETAGLPLEERYLRWVSVFERELVEALTGGDGAAPDPAASLLEALGEVADLPPVDRLLHANLLTYLPGDLHVKVDRMTMAHGLEARSPFLDTSVIELLAAVPARHKVGFRRIKPLLRDAFGPLLPEAVWRRPKHGFGVPMDLWFDGTLGEAFADEVLGRDGRLVELLEPAAVGRLLREHRDGSARRGPQLWTLLTLERWLRDLHGPEPLREPGGDPVRVVA
ncbi:MAG TPA: asparagine synthase (glutamine-hydrolyzing) [Baekduia sp.]|nr:asparagine synthase (glutamine-hydrolyzing) [Baekduia sp.]